jgi:hypothetical protein
MTNERFLSQLSAGFRAVNVYASGKRWTICWRCGISNVLKE